ncbi:TetR/AcrR family transcriptional regulator [Haloarchaeobius amylolyticus]|uniref:TetR/AcrR family transcriptional regulator n=1 Tax=Haloarchaeobius amylolyticus TaxID=1198296 RepID=UPI00226D7323|nr:TetR/AcrR family transcriptional regulator [Haloarchaeobius amylolyticus]
MGETQLFAAAPEDTRAAIMRATYEALTSHGYANLTIQRIADEFEKSKSLLYHHYDGKDDLLVDFLQYMVEHFEQETTCAGCSDPGDRLDHLLDRVVPVDIDPEKQAFTAAMIELRAQAPHDPAYREQFTEHDRALRDRFADILRDGIEDGTFADVDPAATADFLLTLVNGIRHQRVTRDDDGSVPAARAELDAYVDRRLRGGER